MQTQSSAAVQTRNIRELKGKVLVVEDDAMMGNWLQKKLQSRGLDVLWVSSAAAAIKELNEKQYHAVITDVFLENGGESGLELIHAISKLDIPAIVITAKADLHIAKDCINSGVQHFIEKPVDVNEIVDALVQIWESPRGLATLAERFFELNHLTEREKGIGRLALKGLSNREIAEMIGNTEKTVKFHMTIIYDKCSVGSRTEFFSAILPT